VLGVCWVCLGGGVVINVLLMFLNSDLTAQLGDKKVSITYIPLIIIFC